GVENILKRISAYHDVPLPAGQRWHTELFLRFCDPPHEPLPLLFDAGLRDDMRPFRTFRHIARTSYGIELDWSKVAVGIDEIGSVVDRFRDAVTAYLD